MIALWAGDAPFLPISRSTLDANETPYIVLGEDNTGGSDEVTVLIVGGAQVTAELLDLLPRLKLLIRAGVGVDRIDVEAATRRGIAVSNVPDYGTAEVADHTITLMLAVVRSLTYFRSSAQQWYDVQRPPVIRLTGSRLGIVGLGRIGTAVADRARALGMEVVGHDPWIAQESFASSNVAPVDLDQLLQTSEVITLHAPLTDETRGLLDRRAFGRMRRRPYLINTARGELIDTAELRRALDAGTVSGAGLDVLENEPDLSAHQDLFDRPNVIITPHIAWYSAGSEQQLGESAAQYAVDFLERGVLPAAVINIDQEVS